MSAPEQPLEKGYETQDLTPRRFKWGVIVVFLLLGGILSLLFFGYQKKVIPGGEMYPLEAPSTPLEIDSGIDFQKHRANEESILNSYGFIDPEKETARIPISRAMELLIEKGTKEEKKTEEIKIDQNLNALVPLTLPFSLETGERVSLREAIGEKPTILVLTYFECPHLCTLVLNSLTACLRKMKLQLGEDYRVITVSIDPSETPLLAKQKKQNYIKLLSKDHSSSKPIAEGWSFLTGDAKSIQELTKAVGFHYRYDPRSKQFLHGSGILILTPQGHISRYILGVEYPHQELNDALLDASTGKTGSFTHRLILFCHGLEELAGKNTPAILRGIQGACLLSMIGILFFLFYPFLRKTKKREN